MASISIYVGDEVEFGDLVAPGCLRLDIRKHLGEGEARQVFARDTVYLHADTTAQIRAFAEKLLAAIPAEAAAEPQIATTEAA